MGENNITRVALAGATGNLGPAILEQLVLAGFQVTVLTRDGGAHALPSSVSVKHVDYDSVQSLTSALQGQDAVVSTLGDAARKGQLNLVEAASQAGVKRFIPSEFGSNTVNPKAAALPCYATKVAVQKAVEEKAKTSNGMTYTLILTGPFLDWGIMVGFILNTKDRKTSLYDGGNRVFSTTTQPTIGRAVVGVLRHLEETKNRPVYVQEVATSLRELTDIAKKAKGHTGTWTEIDVKIDDVLAQGWEELKKPNPDPNVFAIKFITAAIWGDGTGSHFSKLDNDLLGIKELSTEELEQIVARYV
ncbi:hypothetical protein BD289DRAFT_268725 [Coniella lustricola]|uniref:NmrA-like domain-containing protein n=1 Tax=Coniella lustricola TaxID=2025994 RepID=A0A2T3A727_9PEZI|nr:hypothetical protein BD289DRAFT_268725 [Coniella lustricola]